MLRRCVPRASRPVFVPAVVAMTTLSASAQRGGGAGAGDGPTPRQSAPVDLTGYWVSIVIEDWRYRMSAAAKGDTGGVPLNAEGRRVAGQWNPSRDVASGEACRAYGAPGLMRLPGRLHITWQDDYTLRVDADAGTQTRLLRFANPQGRGGTAAAPAGVPPERTWQGQSAGAWDSVQGAGASRWGTLRVVTTQLRTGYLRRNGVPYSEHTALTEYFDLHPGPRDTTWITITTVVNDPTYLTQEFVTSTDFRKEPDGSKWAATQCSVE